MEGDGTLSTKKKGSLTFARSERVRHNGPGSQTIPHKIKLGGKYASLNKEDSVKVKQQRREQKEEEDVLEELNETEDSENKNWKIK